MDRPGHLFGTHRRARRAHDLPLPRRQWRAPKWELKPHRRWMLTPCDLRGPGSGMEPLKGSLTQWPHPPCEHDSPPNSQNQFPALYVMGSGCVEWLVGWGMEMKGVLFVFWITSYIPTMIIWKNVKKFFRFKMPYTIKGRRKWPSFRRTTFPSLTFASSLTSPPPSLS